MYNSKRRYGLFIVLFSVFLLALLSPVQAVSVSISPQQIEEGDTITIAISGLTNGSVFALRMESAIELEDNTSEFTYQANQVTVPFALNNPRVNLLASPVIEAGLEASDGGVIRRIIQEAYEDEVSLFQRLDSMPAGTMNRMKAFGTVVDNATYVDMTLELSGTKEGPDSGSITFGLEGISDGSARIIVLVDGSQVMNQEVIIGSPTITPTPHPTAPPASSSNGGQSGQPAVDGVIVSSLDSKVRLTTLETSIADAPVEEIRIIQSEPINLPSDWIALSDLYIITPSDVTFTPHAELSFLSNNEGEVPFIASYSNNEWRMVPSRFVGSYLVTEIGTSGQYALFTYPATDQTQSETPESTQAAATPSGTVVPVDSTEIPQTQIPQTQESAGGLMALIGAGIVGSIIIARTRRP